MTNYERVKNMSVEEMANFILTISDDEEIYLWKRLRGDAMARKRGDG